MAVTPVRISSLRITDVWPTATPATSVMAFSGPVGITPTLIPSSRALGRTVCAVRIAENKTNTKRILMIVDYTCRQVVGSDYIGGLAGRTAFRKRPTTLKRFMRATFGENSQLGCVVLALCTIAVGVFGGFWILH